MSTGEEDVVVDGTAPYPWPWNGRLEASRLALVAVGCQRWCAERTVVAERALAALHRTASAVREAGGLVVAARHGRSAGTVRRPSLLPRPGEGAWQLVEPWMLSDLVVDAGGIDAFFGSSLDTDLRSLGRDTLVLGGLGLETAVYSTMTGANDRGYECLALIDASAPHDAQVAARALASIKMSGGIFGAVGTSTSLCAALAGASPRLRKEPA